VPSGTPQDVVTRLNAAFIQVVQQPEVKERLAKQGLEASPDYSPAQLAVYMRKEAAKWRDVIKASGATAD
jgi:tripartite-type tricarboxylate transporter receptor subunit TctC